MEIKGDNVLIVGRNIFDQPIKNNLKTYDNIREITTGQGDDYKIGGLLDCPYFKEHHRLIRMSLSKQQVLNADPKSIQKIILLQI